MKQFNARKICLLAMLCAFSFVMVLVGRLIPNVAGFLSYDPKDAVVVIAGFIYGPVTAVIISVVVSFIELISISGTGIYGMIMNIFSTCAFAVPAAMIYKKMHTMKGAVLGLLTGVVFMTGCMVLWNYIITPYYMRVDRAVVKGMLLTTFLPFNLVKGGINMGLTMLFYKPLTTALRKARLIPETGGSGSKKSVQIGFTVSAVFILVTFVILFLLFAKVL